MIKRISFTAYMDIDINKFDEEDQEEAKLWKFNDFEDSDYDSIGRPLNMLEDEGWVITNKRVKNT